MHLTTLATRWLHSARGRPRVCTRARSQLHRPAIVVGLLVVLTIALTVVTVRVGATSADARSGFKSTPIQLALVLPAIDDKDSIASAPELLVREDPIVREQLSPQWREETVTVRSGDTLAAILARFGLGPALIHKLTTSSDTAATLANLHPGQTLQLRLSESGELHELVLERSATGGVRAWKTADSFAAEVYQEPVESRVAFATGTISGSLYGSAMAAGLSERTIMALADIFAWDIDFALDIRAGDSFTVMYEEQFIDGEKLGDGEVLAAEFVNQGRRIQAIRFLDDEGHASYYTPDGHSMRKAFLRSPVKFSRISSRFSLGRRHPILHKLRAHKGVDYAASRGTPVKASGDGKVAFVGTKGGYGRTVILQHARSYSTLYAHLTRAANGLRTGDRVRQGETIGYVGSTGLATGPHLHYEFRVNGVHKDPLTVALPTAEPIAPKYAAQFATEAELRLAQLGAIRGTQIARND